MLRADPAERVLEEVLGGTRQTAPGASPPSAEQLADANTRLQALLQDFRAEARSSRALGHTLIVHVRDDPEWPRFTPLDRKEWTFGRKAEAVVSTWRWGVPQLKGLFHSKEASGDAMKALKHLVRDASLVIDELLPGSVALHNPIAWWVIDLYRSAWTNPRVGALPCVCSDGQEAPLSLCRRVRAGEELHPFERLLQRVAAAVEYPPSCWYATLSTDPFSACAEKVALLLASLRTPQSLWLPASWYTQNSRGVNAELLRKARSAKKRRVRWHKAGDNYLYELTSVCEYVPACRDDLLEALRQSPVNSARPTGN